MKKLLPLLLGAVLMGGGYVGYTKFFAAAPKESPVEAQAAARKQLATEKKQRRKDKLSGPVVSLGDPFVVNLADPGLSAFVKVNVSVKVDVGTPLEAGKTAAEEPALEEQPQLRDIVLGVLGGKSSSELATLEGREDAKEELLERMNAQAPESVALEIFFTDVAIQASA